MTDIVDATETELRKAEADLEAIGRKICNQPGSEESHAHINAALGHVREAIRSAYRMRGA